MALHVRGAMLQSHRSIYGGKMESCGGVLAPLVALLSFAAGDQLPVGHLDAVGNGPLGRQACLIVVPQAFGVGQLSGNLMTCRI